MFVCVFEKYWGLVRGGSGGEDGGVVCFDARECRWMFPVVELSNVELRLKHVDITAILNEDMYSIINVLSGVKEDNSSTA